MLVLLLEKDRYVSWFYRSAHNPQGIGSSATIIRTRNLLASLNLIEEYEGERGLGGTRINLRLTETGRKIAELLKSIGEIMKS